MGLFSKSKPKAPVKAEGSGAATSAGASAPPQMAAGGKAHTCGSVVGSPAADVLLTDEATQNMVSLRKDIYDGKSTIILEWWGWHWGSCAPAVTSIEQLSQKYASTGKLKVCLISTVGGGDEESSAAEELGVQTCKRYSCIELPPEYAVATPMCTVIHRSGLVVRNGRVTDLDTLIPAMLAEPDE